VPQIAEVDGMPGLNRHKPLRALIADDDPISLMILESVLVSLKIETFAAANVAHAKKILTQIAPDIAILDVLLPDGDGVDILIAIRKAQLATHVALVSATLAEFPFHKCGPYQPDVIFQKPIDPEKIGAWIEMRMAKTAASRLVG
jgi:CheY-like chemotaxis protein